MLAPYCPRLSESEKESIRQRLPLAWAYARKSIQIIIDPERPPGGCFDTVTMRSRKRAQGGAVFWVWLWPDGTIADWEHHLIYNGC